MNNTEKKVILMSACLLGINCNYKSSCSYDFSKNNCFWSLVNKDYIVIPICPEQLGGLPTPRIPSELKDSPRMIEIGEGIIINKRGDDVTKYFKKGAEEVIKLARMYNVHSAVLKSKSPSCGIKSVYDGSFSGVLINNQGFTAYSLKRLGIHLFDEADFCEKYGCTLSDFKIK